MKIQILVIILIAVSLIVENHLYAEARCAPSDKPCLGPPIPVSSMGKQDSLEHAKAMTGMWWVSLPTKVPSNLTLTPIRVRNDPPCCAQITVVYLPPGIAISDNDTNYNFVNSGGFSILYLKQEGGPTANLTKNMEIITTGPCYGVEPCPSAETKNMENMSNEVHPTLTSINNRLAMVSPSQIDINAGNCMGKVNCWLQIFVGSYKYNSTDLIPIAQSITIPSPLEQFKSGAAIKDILCNQDLQLVIKAEDGSPACVNPQTVEKLASRGWTTVVANTSDNSVTKTAYNDISKLSGIILLGNQTYYMTTFNDTLYSIPSSGADISFHGVLFTLLRPLVSNANGDLYEVDVKFTSDNTNESLVIYPVGVGAVQQDRVLSKHTHPQVGFLVYQRNAIKLLVSSDANSPNIQTQNGDNTTLSNNSTASTNQTYYPVYVSPAVGTINASALPPITEIPPRPFVSTTALPPITESTIINYSDPNATKILSVGMSPNPLKVGDNHRFTVTYKNTSGKPLYGITSGCSWDLSYAMSSSNVEGTMRYDLRMCVNGYDGIIEPEQTITEEAGSFYNYKIIHPGLLHVTLALRLSSHEDFSRIINDTIQFDVNAIH